MAQPVVKQEFIGFRADPSTDDAAADEAEAKALEAAIKPLIDKLEVLYGKYRPGFEPPDVHSNA